MSDLKGIYGEEYWLTKERQQSLPTTIVAFTEHLFCEPGIIKALRHWSHNKAVPNGIPDVWECIASFAKFIEYSQGDVFRDGDKDFMEYIDEQLTAEFLYYMREEDAFVFTPKLRLDKLNCSRGAPMGRFSDSIDPDNVVLCGRVPFVDDAYDTGGAYWGMPANLWMLSDGLNVEAFQRAGSLEEIRQEYPRLVEAKVYPRLFEADEEVTCSNGECCHSFYPQSIRDADGDPVNQHCPVMAVCPHCGTECDEELSPEDLANMTFTEVEDDCDY